MFRPELQYLIQRVNNDEAPLFNQEKMELLIDVLVFIISLIIISIFGYEIMVAMGKMCWGLLTPGQQWKEILMIIGAIGFLVIFNWTLNEITRSLVKKFNYLKEQNTEKVKRIAQLEEDNAALKKKIVVLENKNEFLDTINHLLELGR